MSNDSIKKKANEFLEETKALGNKVIASDYIFRPILDGISENCGLLIHKVSVPVLNNTQLCSISILETESGFGAKIIKAMQDMVEFVSEMTISQCSANESVSFFQCKFIEVKPAEWSWHDRRQLISHIVSVEMTKIEK